ncbi:MAG: RNA 3'-terminal phosphate cyclase [Euryarchaeota archaeon]|nr:RNA 3'-terminal phosphate cyclase [Euryarchaeota archaeon]
MVIIDGKTAGGQLLRSSLGLSAITGKPIKFINIRGARAGGAGLKSQHLEGVLAVAQLCDAEVKGAKLGSTEIEFIPEKLKARELNIELPTAGSIGLLYQSLQVASAYANDIVKIKIKGGSTASTWSPPVQYTQNVFLPIVKKIGYNAEIKIIKEGFYPKGGALVEITVYPVKKLNSIQLTEPGEVKSIKGISIAGSLPEHVAVRQANAAKKFFIDRNFLEVDIPYQTVNTMSPGTSITLWAECENTVLGSDNIGKKGKPAEKVAEEAALELINSIKSGAALDKYMADQILVFLSLCDSESKVTVEKITEHCLTNIGVIEKILPVKFEIKGEKGEFGEISVKGINLENKLI